MPKKGCNMRSLSQKRFSTAVRRLLAKRHNVRSASPRARPQTDAPLDATAGRGRGPSAMAARRDLDAFRQAQGAPYWHHDARAS
jgi:hypothetical protein